MKPAIKLYADGASIEQMDSLVVDGYTLNPMLLRKLGVTDYSRYCQDAVNHAKGKPISIQVLDTTPTELIRQARLLASWGDNVYVKIPFDITDAQLRFVVQELYLRGIKINFTGILTATQVSYVAGMLGNNPLPHIVSIFAGRIADCGIVPQFYISSIRQEFPQLTLLYASCRQPIDHVIASQCGCDIVTMSPELIAKRGMFSKHLHQRLQETMQDFATAAANFTL